MASLRAVFYKFKKKKTYRRSHTPKLNKCPQKKATVKRLLILSPKKPNSAKRKAARVSLDYNKKLTFAYIPGIKHNLVAHSSVLIRGGRVRDLPGMAYKMIRGVYDFAGMKATDRKTRLSSYGVKKEISSSDILLQQKKIILEKKLKTKKKKYQSYKKKIKKKNNYFFLKLYQQTDYSLYILRKKFNFISFFCNFIPLYKKTDLGVYKEKDFFYNLSNKFFMKKIIKNPSWIKKIENMKNKKNLILARQQKLKEFKRIQRLKNTKTSKLISFKRNFKSHNNLSNS